MFSRLVLPEAPIRVIISSDAENVLWENNCGPGHEEIVDFLETMQISQYYSASDLLQQYQSLLSRSSRSELHCEVEAEVFSDLTLDPPLPPYLFPSALQSETEKVLVTVAAQPRPPSSWSIGSAFNTSSHEASNYALSAKIIEVSRGGQRFVPYEINEQISLVTSLESFFSEGSAQRIWEAAESEIDICLSLVCGAMAMISADGHDAKYSELRSFCVGTEFMSSLSSVQGLGSGRFSGAIRGVCTQLVAGLCQRHIGIFGRPQQVQRADGALGWRVHVTKGAEGLRLMFWEKDGVLEFANVGVKKELQIKSGNPALATSIDLSELL